MACSAVYSEAWQFISFWCMQQMIRGLHEGVGPADAALVYAAGDFVNRGVEPNIGMIIYNTTAGTNGEITARTATTITATGVTWDNLDAFRLVLANGLELSTVDHYLRVAASDITMALATVGACDCTFRGGVLTSGETIGYLAKLNIIDAATYYNCRCGNPRFEPAVRAKWIDWMAAQLQGIVSMEIELCAGHTGSSFPAMGWAEQATNDFAAAQIIWHDILRNT
jgi:hypothetical protein